MRKGQVKSPPADAHEVIQPVQRRVLHRYQHLAGAGFGRGDVLAILKDVRIAVSIEDDCADGSTPQNKADGRCVDPSGCRLFYLRVLQKANRSFQPNALKKSLRQNSPNRSIMSANWIAQVRSFLKFCCSAGASEMAEYKPFILRVGQRTGEAYPVTADALDWYGHNSIPADLPLLLPDDLQQAAAWQERALHRSVWWIGSMYVRWVAACFIPCSRSRSPGGFELRLTESSRKVGCAWSWIAPRSGRPAVGTDV